MYEDENPDFSFESALLDVSRTDAEAMQFILMLGVNINCHDNKGMTPLMYASAVGNIDVLCTLLFNGAEVDLHVGGNGITALKVAVINDNVDCIMYLLEAGSVIDQQFGSHGWAPLAMAAGRGHYDAVAALLEKGADPNLQNRYTETSWTALMFASQEGHHKIVDLLLQKGADPNIQSTEQKWTALMISCQNNHIVVAKHLLQGGANPNLQTGNGHTALMLASSNGHYDVAALLLHHKANPANVNMQDKDGRTALIYACKNGCLKIVELLLDNFADPTIQCTCNGTKWTAMMYACSYGHYAVENRDDFMKIIEHLMLYGVDVAGKCGDKAPILMSCATGDLDFVQAMLNQEQSWSSESFSKMFGIACFNGHSKVAIFFLSKIQGIDESTVKLATACAEGNDAEVISMIIESKVDVCVVAGITPLMIASACGHEEVVRLLAEADDGKYVSYVDDDGLTALDYAKKSQQINIVKMLEQYEESEESTCTEESTEEEPANNTKPNLKTRLLLGVVTALDENILPVINDAIEEKLFPALQKIFD